MGYIEKIEAALGLIGRQRSWAMWKVGKIAVLPRIGKAAGRVAAAALFSAVLYHSGAAQAGHGGGGGFHGGGGGFHGGGFGGFHGGGAAFNHNHFAGHGFDGNRGFRGGRFGLGAGLGLGFGFGLGYPYYWGYYPPDYGYYGDSQPYATTQYWYYCSNPAGYYPYVTQCATGWQPVPAS